MIIITASAFVRVDGGKPIASIHEAHKFDEGEGANEYTEKLLKWIDKFPHPGEDYPPRKEVGSFNELMKILDKAGVGK